MRDFSIQPAWQAAPSASRELMSLRPYTHTSARQVPVCQPCDWYSPDLWQDLSWKQIIFNPAPSSLIQFRAQHQNSHTNTASQAGSPSQVWAGKRNSCWSVGNAGLQQRLLAVASEVTWVPPHAGPHTPPCTFLHSLGSHNDVGVNHHRSSKVSWWDYTSTRLLKASRHRIRPT